MAKNQKLRIKQLDRHFTVFRRTLSVPPPRKGWLHEIRLALGMNLRQFAERMGSSAPQTANATESNEADGRISLNSLRAAARAINCELVYAVVPRESLGALIRARAEEVARARTSQVSQTMSIEDQALPPGYVESQFRDLVEAMVANPPKDLWESRTLG